ncbi:hypothetical protein O181_001606 [Austropuccinia psidii MF-1]|uniref:Uncharacterized protein n=1 Tax=Austropuccinia psidii MF-1 TaxID=1389203 RepID=A0A9Q3GCK1_9BASI|nr:hypothetical protein [Austropuccinia psidii MF-1]
MFGYHISPILYAPKGPVNLTVSQVVDHAIKSHYKNDTFLIQRPSSVMAEYTRDGNLYSNKNQSQVNFAQITEEKDWHTLMGHPSDRYLEHLLTQLEPRRVNKPTKALKSEGNAPNSEHIHLPSPQLAKSVKTKTCDATELANESNPGPATGAQRPSMKGWDYVLHYETAPQDISRLIDEQNIIEGS